MSEEQSKDTEVKVQPAPPEPSQLRIDVQTLRPAPRAIVTFKGVEYPVLSLLDVKFPQMVGILGAGQEPAVEGQSKVLTDVQRTRKQLLALVPTLPADVLDEMTYREIVAFLEAAMGSGENPQSGDPTSS